MATHIENSVFITDQNMTFGEFKETAKYNQNIDWCLRQVRSGQHLRFINNLYRSVDVCVEAVLSSRGYDMSAVPIQIHNQVVDKVLARNPTINDFLNPMASKLELIDIHAAN